MWLEGTLYPVLFSTFHGLPFPVRFHPPFFSPSLTTDQHQQKSRADIISAKLQPPINGRAIPPCRPASSASIASSQVAEGGLHCHQQNMDPQ